MRRECLWIDCDLLGEIIAIIRTENFAHARRTHIPELIYWSSNRLRTQTLQHGKWIQSLRGENFVRDTLCCLCAEWRRIIVVHSNWSWRKKNKIAACGESGTPPQVQLCNCLKIVRTILLWLTESTTFRTNIVNHVNGKKLFEFLHSRRLSKLPANL